MEYYSLAALEVADRTGIDVGNLLETGRIFTFATRNRRDIVRRLMGTSEFYKHLSFADAFHQYRYTEEQGLVYKGDGYIVTFHDMAEI